MNKKEIKLGNKKFLVVNLNQPLKLDTEVYPGDPKLERKIFSEIDKTGWHHYIHQIGDHNFQPHGDAPNHQNPDMQDKGFEFWTLDYHFNSAFLIDLSGKIEIKKEHLEPFSSLLSKKEAVLIRTGYDKWLEANKPHTPENLPYLNAEAAEFLSSFKNIKVVGIDSLTVDPPGKHAAHQLLKNVLIVESLVHLYEIPLEAREDFTLETSPVQIVGATGGPIVAHAFIEL